MFTVYRNYRGKRLYLATLDRENRRGNFSEYRFAAMEFETKDAAREALCCVDNTWTPLYICEEE